MLEVKARRVVALLFGATIAVGLSTKCAGSQTESFDKPIRKTVRRLGTPTYPTPGHPDWIRLSCFYYRDFLVKQLVYPAVKGSQWVSIAPVDNKSASACQTTHSPRERFVTQDGWFFMGVKGSFLLLEAPDGDENAGMPFRVIDTKSGDKLFEDSEGGSSRMGFAHTPDGNVLLRYVRRLGGDCSIPKDGMSCWRKFIGHYGVLLATAPECVGYRREGDKEWTTGDEGVPPEDISVPSSIDYPVAVDLFPHPSIRAVPGPVQCFAE